MNVSFTDQQEEYIVSLVESGDYKNASEAIREAIQFHKKYHTMFEELRAEIEKGFVGPPSKRNVKDIIAAKTGKKSYGRNNTFSKSFYHLTLNQT